MKKLLFGLIIAISITFAGEGKLLDLGNGYLMFEKISVVEFKPGTMDIVEYHKQDIGELIKFLKKNREYKVKIIGRADNKGDPATNMALSKKRALVVKRFLVKGGIPAKDIIIEARGDKDPIADNSTPAGQEINRSAEIQLFKR